MFWKLRSGTEMNKFSPVGKLNDLLAHFINNDFRLGMV